MKIIILGAHPDDIEISAGGTIAKYLQKKHEVLLVVVTIPYNKEIRRKEAENGAEILGTNIKILDLDPNEIIFSRKLVKIFDELFDDFSPDIVFTHWNNDSHQDHVAISYATIAATRQNRCSVYMYEQTIPGGIVPYGFRSQFFVDISNVIDLKIKSTLAHKSEIEGNTQEWIDGIKGRAHFRGFQIGVKYAEAFEVVKEIDIYSINKN